MVAILGIPLILQALNTLDSLILTIEGGIPITDPMVMEKPYVRQPVLAHLLQL